MGEIVRLTKESGFCLILPVQDAKAKLHVTAPIIRGA